VSSARTAKRSRARLGGCMMQSIECRSQVIRFLVDSKRKHRCAIHSLPTTRWHYSMIGQTPCDRGASYTKEDAVPSIIVQALYSRTKCCTLWEAERYQLVLAPRTYHGKVERSTAMPVSKGPARHQRHLMNRHRPLLYRYVHEPV